MFRSVHAQLLVTVMAAGIAAAFFTVRGLPTANLADALWDEDIDQVRRALAWGASPTCDVGGDYPLFHTACLRWGHPAMIELFLDAGADVDLRSPSGDTPLMFAAAGGGTKAVTVLLARGADVHARNAKGCTPLHAATNGDWRRGPGCQKILVAHGAEVNAVDFEGRTALDRTGRLGASQYEFLRSHGAKLGSELAAPPQTSLP